MPHVNICASQTGSASRNRWLVFAAMLMAEVMDVLDANIINVAAPELEHYFDASQAQLQWAIGGYALAMGAGLIVGGRLGDLYGRRRMFLLAMSGFALASVLCASASGMSMLIVARLLQGMTGALLLPPGFALLREVFGPQDLAKAMAIFGPVLGIASVAGPVLGGAIVNADIFRLGWRFAFAVNVPIACGALAIAWRYLPRDRRTSEKQDFDLVGSLIVPAASGLLLLPLAMDLGLSGRLCCRVSDLCFSAA